MNTHPSLGWARHLFRVCVLLVFAALPFLSVSLSAQTPTSGSIEGRIKHGVTGDYLNNVRVSVVGTNLVALTDESGFYRIDGVPAGKADLRVFHGGLDEQQIAVTVIAGQTAQQNLALTNKALYGAFDETIQLDAFVVQATKETNAQAIAVNEQRFSRTQKSVVSADQFGTIADSNPGELMKWLPGVSVEYFANNITAVSVRGLDAANTEIQFDGMPMASASTSSTGRGFEMMGASAADVSRIEVRKLRTPDTSANALGGSLNLIRKSAFEASRASLNYKVGMTTDFEDFGFNKRPGTRDNKIFGWRPNAQLTWTHPVSKTFGYVVTLGHEDVLARVHWSSPSRNYGNAANAVTAKARIDAGLPLTTPSVYNPARTQDLLHDNPKQDIKDYASIKFDWRPTTELKLSYSLNGSLYTERTGDDLRVTWATGTTVYNDETSTYGATGTGAFQYDMREAWRNGTKPVINQVISGEWKKGDWTIGAKGSYSVSKQTYKDTDDGFFSGTTMPGSTLPNMGIGTGKANPQLITMNLLDQSYSFSRRIEARNASGGLIDLNDLSNIYIGGAVSRQGQIVETIAAARLYAERSFGFRNALSLKVGFDYDEIYRNRKRYDAKIWTFVGPDGQAGTFDDNASQIQAVSTRPERDTYYDAPAVTRVSMSRLYDLYKAHPNWFVYRAGESHRFSVTDPYEINEQTYAPYFQFTGTFFNNRLSYIGGVRYERADAWGLGLKDNGGPVINGASTLEQAQARYERKGARGEGSNDGYFPSLESSYNITENLILRAGYAKTQAKNRFERSVIPTNSINHDGTNSAFPTAEGTITFRNANLTPWTANNYEAHLEYYTPQGGVIGVGAFRKNIGNNQVSKSVLLDTPQRVAEFGLDPEYLNYVATTWLNEGVGRLDGVEFETRQPLDVILPGFARGFVFTGSFNYNNLSKFNYANGNISTDFQNFYETQIKGSLIYRRGRFGASAGMIRNGEVYRQRDDAAGFEGHRYYPAYTTVDFSLDYALTKWAKLSISGRNVTNAHKTRIREVQNAPAWSQLHIENNLGVTYTVGISGTF